MDNMEREKAILRLKQAGLSRRAAGALVFNGGIMELKDVPAAYGQPSKIALTKNIGERSFGEILAALARNDLLRFV